MTTLTSADYQQKIRALIDNLKGICATYGLGNDGNEFKIITQVFLYKFLHDKFAYEVKQAEPSIAEAAKWEQALRDLAPDEYELLCLTLPPGTAVFQPEQFIAALYDRHQEANFSQLFDETLRNIASQNNEVFAVKTEGGAKIPLFERVSQYISDPGQRDGFCRAMINQLVKFSVEGIFAETYDFFAPIFEYLIKDYNKDNGGAYAEYYTPHAVAKIMAKILVPEPTQNVTVYDPSAGSGTLLMSIAHQVGTARCTLFSQDISQKSSNLLRLNLILNNLVHSIPNVIQGNTILQPFHKQSQQLKRFDFVVSNPPFKMDFSDFRDKLESDSYKRFFAGIPKVPNKKKDSMAIYTCFLQHIMASLNEKGKAAVVVPTGFITAQSGIDRKIRERLVADQMLAGVVSMPSNIFATTGTNVSILFMDRCK